MRKTNAICPCCFDSWEFDEDYALPYMTSRLKEHYERKGFIFVVCENCCEQEDVYEKTEPIEQSGVVYTRATD